MIGERFGSDSRPVTSAVPAKIAAQPASIDRLTASSSSHQPHNTANAGTRNVTDIALVGPTLAINRKYSR